MFVHIAEKRSGNRSIASPDVSARTNADNLGGTHIPNLSVKKLCTISFAPGAEGTLPLMGTAKENTAVTSAM